MVSRGAGRLSVGDVPEVASTILSRAGGEERSGLRIGALRYSSGRGLVATLVAPQEAGSAAAGHWASLSIDANQLFRGWLRFSLADLETSHLEVVRPGIVDAREYGLRVRRFPADEKLAGLAPVIGARPGGLGFAGLEAAGRRLLEQPGWRLRSTRAWVVAYKPGKRCVIRTELTGQDGHRLVVYSKCYSDPQLARTVFERTQALYAGLRVPGMMARPLGIDDQLGIVHTEAVRGRPLGTPEPSALARVGASLARLHSLEVDLGGRLEAGTEGQKLVAWRARVESWSGLDPEPLARLQATLGERLVAEPVARPAPIHGAFKPAQLLVGDEVAIIDFDGTAMGDPAIDLGGFLAYLRPAELYRGAPRAAAWFSEAAGRFVEGYRAEAVRLGREPSEVTGTIARMRTYEATRLVKLAGRGAARLNSPRLKQLKALLVELGDCLGRPLRWLPSGRAAGGAGEAGALH